MKQTKKQIVKAATLKKGTGSVSPIPASKSESAPKKQVLLWAFALGAFAFLLYVNTLQNGFLMDDNNIIKNNTLVKSGVHGIPEILVSEYRKGFWPFNGTLYRPLPLVVFAVLWEFFPNNPAPFHLVNCIVFALTAVLLFLLLSRMLKQFSIVIPLLITALFVVHPIHTEVVANNKSLDELLSFLFSLSGCYFLLKYLETKQKKILLFLSLAYFLALLSKEGAVTFVAVFPLLLYYFTTAKRSDYLITGVFYAIPAVIYLLIRNYVLTHQTGHPYHLEAIDNPMVLATDIWTRTASSFSILGKYLWMSLYPHPLSMDYSFNQIPLTDWTNITAVFSFLVYLALGILIILRWRLKEAWLFGILFFLITISLYSNLFYLIGTNFAERLLYTPSFGICIAFVLLLDKFLSPKSILPNAPFSQHKVVIGIVGVFAIVGSVKTVARNQDWKDHISLYTADIKNAPQSAHLNYWYGNEITTEMKKNHVPLANQKAYYDSSNYYLSKAIQIYPAYGSAYVQRGLNYFEQNIMDSAKSDYLKAIESKVSDWSAYSNVGVIFAQRNQLDSAMKYFRLSLQVDTRPAAIYKNMANVFYIRDQYPDAISNYLIALQKANEEDGALVQEAKASLSELYAHIGDSTNAKKYSGR